MEHKRGSYAEVGGKRTVGMLLVGGGSISLNGCLFRNFRIGSAAPQEPPTISFGKLYPLTSEIINSSGNPDPNGMEYWRSDLNIYTLDNLNRFCVPNVFMDTNDGEISEPYISTTALDQTSIQFGRTYLVFLCRSRPNVFPV
jgi:hypothetical protein